MSMKQALKAWHKILDGLDEEMLTEDQVEGLKVMVKSTGHWGDPILRWKAIEMLAMYNTIQENRRIDREKEQEKRRKEIEAINQSSLPPEFFSYDPTPNNDVVEPKDK